MDRKPFRAVRVSDRMYWVGAIDWARKYLGCRQDFWINLILKIEK